MGELTWDYLGWEKFNRPIDSVYRQRDWNRTLITYMNQLNAQNFQTLHNNNIDGACLNRIKMNENLLDLIKDFEYTVINNGVIKIGTRFEVEVDNNLPKNKILILKENKDKEILVESVLNILNYVC